jgi:hypothetical protein
MPDPIDNIGKDPLRPESIDATGGLARTQPTKSFQQSLQQAKIPSQMEGANVAGAGINPMDLAKRNQGVVMPSNPDANSVKRILAQTSQKAQEVQQKLTSNQTSLTQERQQQLKAQLTPNQQMQLKQRIKNAHQNISQVAQKLGIDPNQFKTTKASMGPFGKLFDMLSQGQKLLNSTKDQLPSLIKGNKVNPGDFLALQFKLSVASLDLDFSSQVLGKGVDAFTRLMNINI